MFCQDRLKCPFCRFRNRAIDSEFCVECTEAMSQMPIPVRMSLLKFFSGSDPVSLANLVRYLITMLPTDADMGQVLGPRTGIASDGMRRSAEALEEAARQLHGVAGFIGTTGTR